jgi:hypothetical protein
MAQVRISCGDLPARDSLIWTSSSGVKRDLRAASDEDPLELLLALEEGGMSEGVWLERG